MEQVREAWRVAVSSVCGGGMEGMEGGEEGERWARETGWRRVAKLSAQGLALNAAAPVALLVQAAVVGRESGALLAAFAAVTSAVSLVGVVFNFLSDGITAKVSEAVGRRQWRRVAQLTRWSLSAALGLGLACSAVLFALEGAVFLSVLVPAEVEGAARQFYAVKALSMPVVLLQMASSGVLSGYQHLGLASGINVARGLLDILGTVAVVSIGGSLVDLGVSSLIASGAALVAGLLALEKRAPVGAPETFRAGFRARSRLRRGLEESLLAEGAIEGLEGGTGLGRAGERRAAGSAGSGGGAGRGRGREPEEEGFWDFVGDGLNMVLRTLLLTSSFYAAAAFASRVPEPDAAVHGRGSALAAHGIVVQLWILQSYITDGIASVGTMVGGKLYGAGTPTSKQYFRILTRRLLLLGLAFGLGSVLFLTLFRGPIISIFTREGDASYGAILAFLDQVWPVLVAMQPINCFVFVYDGLIYALQRFTYIRNVMVSGFFLVFFPILAYGTYRTHSLLAIWLAKSALNVWRLMGLAGEIHVRVLHQ
mgnify:CR=1 FL=1